MAICCADLREKFLAYFEKNVHKRVQSDLLIPSSDPSLLFTSAGMVQFKKYFLSEQKMIPPRAVTCQKCFRTTDIDNIGHTARHLSFFEMLGNFSFGDYFKKEAINYAWEFLTKEIALDKDRIYITVYKEDDEALELWKKIVPQDKIFKMGEDTNFWKMGDTSPCGPCSEIIYDLGQDISCGPDCSPVCSCDRWLEVWNLVFMQFNRDAQGKLTTLPNKNIDTGMGLERLCIVANGKKNIFETDLFTPVINEIETMLDCKYGNDERTDTGIRLIADHIRAITFLINDGILPANDGRGYVLRRILRRAVRHAKLLRQSKPFLYRLCGKVVSIMKGAYPELALRQESIALVIKMEEEKFLETLDTGIKMLDELIDKNKKSGTASLSGKDVFFLYDTFGFPVELTAEILEEHKMSYSHEEFLAEQDSAKKISKASWKGVEVSDTAAYKKYSETKFEGYVKLSADAQIAGILKGNKPVDSLNEGEQGQVILDTTPFYGESGGQVGDTGNIKSHNGLIEVEDTKKTAESVFIHNVRVVQGNFKQGDKVVAAVDKKRRQQIMRHHTATHLLHKALRAIVGEHATQSGSYVAPDGFRFDFSNPRGLNRDEITKIEQIVNEKIMECIPVNIIETTMQEARKFKATALFGEKYQDIVRCVYAGESPEPAYSVELCGGTHCRNTGEIGVFKIISESSVGSGIRRIEGLCGTVAIDYLNKNEYLIESAAQILRTTPYEVEKKIDAILKQQKQLQQEIEKLRASPGTTSAQETEYTIDGSIKLVLRKYADPGLEQKNLRSLTDAIKDKFKKNTLAMAANIIEEKVFFVFSATEDVIAAGFDVSKFAKDFAARTDGQAGGRKDFAQGGTKDPEKFEKALKELTPP